MFLGPVDPWTENSPLRRRLARGAVATLAALLAALLVGFAAAELSRPASGGAAATPVALAPRAGVALAPPHRSAASAEADRSEFQRRALNALLVPLLDDSEPPRWTHAGIDFLCGPETRVEIDGAPLVLGALLPATAFTVRWQMDQCWPLGAEAFELSGVAELTGFHDAGGLSAVVDARRLRVAGAQGVTPFEAPFGAVMALGPADAGPPPYLATVAKAGAQSAAKRSP